MLVRRPLDYWPVVVFVLFGVILVALSTLKSLHMFLPELKALERFMGGDKWMHFKLAALLGFLGSMSARQLSKEVIIVMPLTLLSLLAALAADELLQKLSPSRAFDLGDLYAGVLGIITGGLFFMVFWLLSSSRGR